MTNLDKQNYTESRSVIRAALAAVIYVSCAAKSANVSEAAVWAFVASELFLKEFEKREGIAPCDTSS